MGNSSLSVSTLEANASCLPCTTVTATGLTGLWGDGGGVIGVPAIDSAFPAALPVSSCRGLEVTFD